MALTADYGLETPARRLLLVALSLEDRTRKRRMDMLHIQKVIRFYEHLRAKALEVDFSNYDMGGVSYELHENIDTLQEYGLVHKQADCYELTREGERAARELRKEFTDDDLQKFAFSKHQLNDLSFEEVMYFMYKTVPETQENSTYYARLEKNKQSLVNSLFLKGRITSATATKWLGISEREFDTLLSS